MDQARKRAFFVNSLILNKINTNAALSKVININELKKETIEAVG